MKHSLKISLIAASVMVVALVARRALRAPAPGPVHLSTIAAAKVIRGDLTRDLVFDAEFRPFQEIDLHAKVAGYLATIDVDIGDTVKAHQRIAELEVPELKDELAHSLALKRKAEQEARRSNSNYKEAHLTFSRIKSVSEAQPNLLAQQDIDTAAAKDESMEASMAAAQSAVEEAAANVSKLETMMNYSHITAPFAGVITKRYADPGALIQAGTASSTQALPLVRLSELDKLRLVFPVSISYLDRVHVGDEVEIRLSSGPKTRRAAVSRLSRKVDMATRTMEAEADVANTDFSLVPGSYASVVLRPEKRSQVLIVPLEAVAREKTASVLIVKIDGIIEEREVKTGMETPTQIEITQGLSEAEVVVLGNRRQLKPGQKVQFRLTDPGA